MGAKKKGLTGISLRILELLEIHPSGLTLNDIRAKLDLEPGAQIHLDRRMRNLYKFYIIEKGGSGNNPTYIYRGEREEAPDTSINIKVAAQIRHRAHGRCGMCGKTVDRHQITLVIDHKVPQAWGGTDDPRNLWAICEECNAGKKDYFESFDPSVMRQVMGYPSPHVRIGELLKLYFKKPVPGWLVEFVAFDQDDWQKRTRELRYLGWDVRVSRKKNAETERVEAFYTLHSYVDWPDEPTKWIADYEAARAKRNREKIGEDGKD